LILDLNLKEWARNNFFQTECCEDLLRTCEDKIERRNYEDLSLEEFLGTYEKGNKPLIIKNITKHFFLESQWNYEVKKIP